MGSSVHTLLTAWRAAARAWESADPATKASVAPDVIRTWLAYQEATLTPGTGEFLLVADDSSRYVAASAGIADVLGYSPDEIVGLTVADLAGSELVDGLSTQWTSFLDDGSQEGEFVLRAADGRAVAVTFHARVVDPASTSPGFGRSRQVGAARICARPRWSATSAERRCPGGQPPSSRIRSAQAGKSASSSFDSRLSRSSRQRWTLLPSNSALWTSWAIGISTPSRRARAIAASTV